MGPAAREVRTAGGDQIIFPGGATEITSALNDYFAPDAADSINPDAVSFLPANWATQPMGEYLVRMDLPRRKAESGMQIRWIPSWNFRFNYVCARRLPLPV